MVASYLPLRHHLTRKLIRRKLKRVKFAIAVFFVPANRREHEWTVDCGLSLPSHAFTETVDWKGKSQIVKEKIQKKI